MDFDRRYKNLNKAQKQAVDTIDGPVMVIAGPGTGKTELLSVRTANILRQTDTLPENILCLTFTDSGANAMRERLTGIIGKDAYKVAIHTFHSFGSEIINQYGEFFYEGAHFRPADELSRYEIIKNIFEGLSHDNVLNKKMNGDYTYLADSLTVISELKKSGLTSDELLVILDANDSAIEKTEQLLSPIFDDKIGKTTADRLVKHIEAIRDSGVDVPLPTIVNLGEVIADSLADALDEASQSNSTKPVTAWRNQWFKKDDDGKFVLKSHERQKKLRAISSIYEQYLTRMSEAELFDFDDMILRVVHAIEIFDELRYNLQERYQYIMVDEFQDTNMAQMRILHDLMDSEVSGDVPNILVVCDDDQAIYSFQGADISNINDFRTTYPKADVINLTENYRSGDHILTHARALISQGSNRLEDQFDDINKSLLAMSQRVGKVELREAQTIADERHWLVEDIKSKIKPSTNLCEIAVLTRTHRELVALLPYFADADIPVQYERRDNVLDTPPIILIERLSRVLIGILLGKHAEVNAMLPELLSHPAWGIKPLKLWQLSLKSYQNRSFWLDEMSSIKELTPLRDWLITTALSIPHKPLEVMLDELIGKLDSPISDDEQDDSEPDNDEKTLPAFHSPIYDYFFSLDELDENSEQYTRYLQALRAIRSSLRDYRPLETPTLLTFIEFIGLHRSIGSGVTSVTNAATQINAVQLMTAHKSKGLEFDDVYIIDAIDSVWGERARGRSRMIGYPENLNLLAPVGDSSDERLRLFYVAATRAKNNLHISYSLSDDSNKATARASFLLGDSWSAKPIDGNHNVTKALETAQMNWYEPVIKPAGQDLKNILATQLENYQLSVTHLNNFLDVTRGGPNNFLIQNLLRFPQAMTPAAGYGSAIHKTLQRAHAHLAANASRQAIEDILHNFQIALGEQRLSQSEFELYSQKGIDDLQAFLTDRYDSFSAAQKTELNFKSQHVIVGEAHLSGALDLIDIDGNLITVTDYKTGHPARSWNGKTDYEKIKLHKYRQQLMFYKLLIENARDYRNFKVESGILQFVEPSSSGAIVSLSTDFNDTDQQRFADLINAVWRHIIDLNMPDTSRYESSIKGILAFEQDLIDNKI